MSRPTKIDKLDKTVQVRVNDEIYDKLKYISKVTGRSISEVIRDYIERIIK